MNQRESSDSKSAPSQRPDPVGLLKRLEDTLLQWKQVPRVPAKVQFGPVAFFPRGSIETDRFLCSIGDGHFVERLLSEKLGSNLICVWRLKRLGEDPRLAAEANGSDS